MVTQDPGKREGPDRAELAVAAIAFVLGLLIFAGSASISLGAGYDRIGPRFFPWVVASGLVLTGPLLAWGAWRQTSPRGEPRHATNRTALGTLTLGLAASVALLERAGFILASTLLFWLVARAFESRRPRRDAAVGALLSLAVYLAFTRGLGLNLPAGFLAGLL